ncbi:uncharacterized protein KY384_005553 [Bacidia gigantensis]|uniref:uncharacterized protein n=1 Tax=Bacidia gigantensis TaxID=2732470 RepID=UPI001D04FFD3|nr:uncharacterized protein KY384_005553 [Bacidia gigantensis]KAG8530071.1 hypothetical protein KY384_005553 [Bacidia gigantensis]
MSPPKPSTPAKVKFGPPSSFKATVVPAFALPPGTKRPCLYQISQYQAPDPPKSPSPDHDEPSLPKGPLTLPTATVQKIISEILATPSQKGEHGKLSVAFARDARELLIECCVEFITLISSEANEIAEKEAKKTIAIEHIDKALRDLGFPEYVRPVLDSAGDAKEMLKTREKRTTKLEQSGLTQEELLEQQQALFRSANEKYNQAD